MLAMDALLDFILELYRAAQDTAAGEFQTLAFSMLQTMVPFRSATWSNAGLGKEGITLSSMHLYNEPQSLIEDLVSMNSKHSAAVSLAAQRPNIAHQHYSPQLFSGREHAEMRDYQKRYGHDKALMITDSQSLRSRGEWIVLYRPQGQDFFTEQDRRAITAIMPHLTEALTINRLLATQHAVPSSPATLNGARALAHLNGITLHVGNRFAEMLREQWPEWQSSRLPLELLQTITRDGQAVIANRTINITAVGLGNLLFLSAKRLPTLSRLGIRELAVIRLFGAGKSHKEIAKKLGLSPVTVRNYIQHVYRKLGIDNKVALARLLETEEI